MESEPASSHFMDLCLIGAFPMWLAELKDQPIDYLQRRASVCAQQIGEKGDALMYGSKKKGAAGEVFNRLAEGMACLCLITKHPVPFNRRVFHHDGTIETFETEAQASERVWPKVPDVPKADQGALQSEKVSAMCGDASPQASDVNDPNANSAGKDADR